MIRLSGLAPAIVFAATVFTPAFAQQAGAPASMEALLDDVAAVRNAENRLSEQRRNEFNASPATQQTAIMKQADERRAALNSSSQKLSDQFSANERQISTLNSQLREKAQALGLAELFGAARQAANDASSILHQSLITTQFPAGSGEGSRDAYLSAFAASRTTPTSAELERVWLEIQREMTASGQVARFTTQVVKPNGDASQSEVVRIGPFTAMSGGSFLTYLPDLRTLTVLPRQLPPDLMQIGQAFEKSTSGYAQAVVDSSRGVLLGMYVERPTLKERIELGEAVGYVIILVGALGILAFIYQLISLLIVRVGVTKQLRNLDAPVKNNPLGRVLLAFKGDPNRIEEDADVAELRITEAVLKEIPSLERFQAFLRLTVAAGPLLGLIGTVVGMIVTFQSITESGSSDPKLMATGIGQAMIATVLGLGIAIPLLFANALLNSLSRATVQVLDEQSAGMLAESIEKKRRG